MVLKYLFVLIVCAFGSTIQSITGFGFALLAIPLFSIFIPLKYGIIILSICAAVLSLVIILKLRIAVDWRLILPVTASVFIGQFIGTSLLFSFSANVIKIVLGVSLILFSIAMLIVIKFNFLKRNLISTICCGLVSGFFGGMLGISGPPLVIYYYSIFSDKYEYQSSLQLTLFFICLFTFIFHSFYGNLSMDILVLSIFGLIGVLIGSFIGLFIFQKVKKESIKKPIFLLISLLGIWNVIEAIVNF